MALAHALQMLHQSKGVGVEDLERLKRMKQKIYERQVIAGMFSYLDFMPESTQLATSSDDVKAYALQRIKPLPKYYMLLMLSILYTHVLRGYFFVDIVKLTH